jgi:hypothetical protein
MGDVFKGRHYRRPWVGRGEVVRGSVVGDPSVGVSPSVAAGPSVVAGPSVTATPGVPAPEAPLQEVRYLRVVNRTGQDLTVYVQTDEDQEPLAWSLVPDGAGYLKVDGERLAAARVWIWAESESAAWADYRDEALTLVEEPYRAADIDTFTYTFEA